MRGVSNQKSASFLWVKNHVPEVRDTGHDSRITGHIPKVRDTNHPPLAHIGKTLP